MPPTSAAVADKTLWLLRHAKSSWVDDGLADHDRPLEARGQRAATLMAAYLQQRGARPRLALCSTARRAVETLERVAALLPDGLPVELDEDLYLASPGALLGRIRRIDEDVTTAILVGHNPGIAELARELARRGDRDALERLAARFPTGALAELRFPALHWGEIEPGSGRLDDFATPKELV